MPTFAYRQSVAAAPATLFALLCDAPRVAALFPFMTVSGLEAPAPGCWRFHRRLAIPSLPALAWREEDRVDGDGLLRFHVLDGDLQTFTGCWQALPEGAGSVLVLELEYAVPPGLRPGLPEPLVHYVMQELFTTICRRIARAAEEAPE